MDHRTDHRLQLARIAVDVLRRPYPYSSGHVATGPDDTDITPERLHPAFHGALDWHSSVHMQWSLVTLLREYADTHPGAEGPGGLPGDRPEELARARDLLGERLPPEHLAVEVAYLRDRPSFERPYGWAWAALLGSALQRWAPAHEWAAAVTPLTEVIAEHVLAWLPRQGYPIRHGKHQNDAFALTLLHHAYRHLGRPDVVQAITTRAGAWFGADGPAPTAQEPSGSDFLSPALTEAVLMRTVLGVQFPAWLERFLPRLGEPGAHPSLLEPPVVRDATDGQGAHLLGLALSRAWALRSLADDLPGRAAGILRDAAQRQESAVLHQVTEGDFMATHWLVSFVLLADGTSGVR